MPTTAPQPLTIAIAGAGIGGLALTIGLLRHPHISVQLYEAAPSFGEIGAGVSFGPNALRAMRLLDPAVRASYDTRATSNGWAAKENTWFDFRHGMQQDGRRIAEVRAQGCGQSSVHRARFLDGLVGLVRGRCGVGFGKRVVGVVDCGVDEAGGGNGGKGVKMLFADGTSAEASALVGCDGIRSVVRPMVLGEADAAARAAFTGKYAYRGLVPMEAAVRLLGEELARNSQMYLGEGGHVLTFPIEGGRTMNVVAFRTKGDGVWEDERWVLPGRREDMLRDFEGWGDSVRSILSLMEKPDVWALFDHPPARTYCKGRICLLGDAAHASTPHQGAGAGMALEDAYVLSDLLGSVRTVEGIEGAFRVYDAVRRPRSQKLVATSRAAGQLYDFEGVEIGDDEDKIRENLENRYRWIWDEDLEVHLNEAKALWGGKAKLA